MRNHTFLGGTLLSEAARVLVQLASTYNEAVRSDFNGIKLVANPGDDATSVESAWQNEYNQREKTYSNSPKYRKQREQNVREVEALKQQLEGQINELMSLDFSNYMLLINWLDRLVEPSDRIGVELDWETIVTAFETHGFQANVNTGDAYKGEDLDNSALWLIGQALTTLKGGLFGHHGVHPIFQKFAKEWLDKFASI